MIKLAIVGVGHRGMARVDLIRGLNDRVRFSTVVSRFSETAVFRVKTC